VSGRDYLDNAKGMILMVKRIAVLFCCLPLLGTVGCVGQSAYEKKAVEATSLSRDLAEMQRRNSELVRDNEALRADITGLRAKIDELDTTRKRLELTISSGEQTPYQFVAELEREKGRLREDLAKLHRTQDDRVRTCSRIYELFLERMKNEIATGQVRLTELRGTIRLELLEEAFFDGTRTELSPQGLSLLRKVAELLTENKDVDASVESLYEIPVTHLDDSGKQLTTWRIPLLRSLSVARYMLKIGIGTAALSTMTRGQFELESNPGMVTDKANANEIAILISVKECG
jgi:chemotaxis protein MotB